MAKFLALCATLIAFLVSSVAASPQEHLAPDAHSNDASKPLVARDDNSTFDYHVSETANPMLSVHERQVHNADYGSDNGPSGNPHTEQQTAQEGSSPTPAAGSESDSGATDYDSAEERRDLAPQPSHDIDYNQSN